MKRTIEISFMILYIPFCVACIGASCWWIGETTEFENPILVGLWGLLRATPALIGFTLIMCAGIVWVETEEWFDRWWSKRSKKDE